MESRLSLAGVASSVLRTAKLSRKIGTRSAVLVETALLKRDVLENPKLVRLTVPGFSAPLYLRAGTSDAEIFYQVIVNGEYDIRSFPQFHEIDRLYRKARAEGQRPLIIDCGANIGLSSVWFSRLFPEAQIFAIEPATDNLEIAKQNLGGYPNVTLLQGAIWDRSTGLKISDATADAWAYQVTEAPQSAGSPDTALRAFTIPELIDMAGTDRALIVKIDIEGAEATLFRSNTEWVGRTHLIAIELHDWMLPKQRTSAPFIRSFANLDFDLLQRGETMFVFIDDPASPEQ
jgi:FkbM family methyltransferase